MKKLLKKVPVFILTVYILTACGNAGKNIEEKLNELQDKTESLDSLLNKEVDKVLTLDSLINLESEKVQKLDSLVNKTSSKLDSISNEKIKRFEKIIK